jgi:hypothetical protein
MRRFSADPCSKATLLPHAPCYALISASHGNLIYRESIYVGCLLCGRGRDKLVYDDASICSLFEAGVVRTHVRGCRPGDLKACRRR